MDVKEALNKFNYSEVTIEQLADYFNFTDVQKNMIKRFWDSTFYNNYILLSDEIILEQLTDEKGKDALSHFYNRILLKCDSEGNPYYKINDNYICITKDHDLVKMYVKLYSPNLASKKDPRGGAIKQYYAVTGDTYSDLLQRSNTTNGASARDYYRKVDRLAKFMKNYIIALHEHIMQRHNDEQKQMLIEHKQMLIEQKQIIAEKDAKFNRINTINMELVSYKKSIDKDESIFIVATYNYATQGVFKVGRTKDMKNRLSGLNLTHISGDKVFLLHEFKVNDSLAINHYIHKKLKGFAARKGSEFFICQYNLLKQIIELIIDGDESYSDTINSIIDDMYAIKSSNHLIADWTRGIICDIYPENSTAVVVAEPIIEPIDEIIDEPIIDDHVSDQIVDQVIATIVDNYVFNFALSTDEQKKEYTLKCIKDYKTTLNQSDEILWKKFQVYLIDQLEIPRYKFKSLKWKAMYMDCID